MSALRGFVAAGQFSLKASFQRGIFTSVVEKRVLHVSACGYPSHQLDRSFIHGNIKITRMHGELAKANLRVFFEGSRFELCLCTRPMRSHRSEHENRPDFLKLLDQC